MAIITAAGLTDLYNQRAFNKNGSTVTLKKISDTEWLLFGDLAEGDSEGFVAATPVLWEMVNSWGSLTLRDALNLDVYREVYQSLGGSYSYSGKCSTDTRYALFTSEEVRPYFIFTYLLSDGEGVDVQWNAPLVTPRGNNLVGSGSFSNIVKLTDGTYRVAVELEYEGEIKNYVVSFSDNGDVTHVSILDGILSTNIHGIEPALSEDGEVVFVQSGSTNTTNASTGVRRNIVRVDSPATPLTRSSPGVSSLHYYGLLEVGSGKQYIFQDTAFGNKKTASVDLNGVVTNITTETYGYSGNAHHIDWGNGVLSIPMGSEYRTYRGWPLVEIPSPVDNTLIDPFFHTGGYSTTIPLPHLGDGLFEVVVVGDHVFHVTQEGEGISVKKLLSLPTSDRLGSRFLTKVSDEYKESVGSPVFSNPWLMVYSDQSGEGVLFDGDDGFDGFELSTQVDTPRSVFFRPQDGVGLPPDPNQWFLRFDLRDDNGDYPGNTMVVRYGDGTEDTSQVTSSYNFTGVVSNGGLLEIEIKLHQSGIPTTGDLRRISWSQPF